MDAPGFVLPGPLSTVTESLTTVRGQKRQSHGDKISAHAAPAPRESGSSAWPRRAWSCGRAASSGGSRGTAGKAVLRQSCAWPRAACPLGEAASVIFGKGQDPGSRVPGGCRAHRCVRGRQLQGAEGASARGPCARPPPASGHCPAASPRRPRHAGRWGPRARSSSAVLCPAGCGGRLRALGEPHGTLSPGLKVHTSRGDTARGLRLRGREGRTSTEPGAPWTPRRLPWGRAATEASALWDGSLRMLSCPASPADADTCAGRRPLPTTGARELGAARGSRPGSAHPGPPPRRGGVRWVRHALGALGRNASRSTGKKGVSFRYVLVPKAERQ